MKPDTISFWYMQDNHAFVPLAGTTLDAIIEQARAAEKASPGGVLCPPTLLSGGREVRRVNAYAHSGGTFAPHLWEEGLKTWRAAVEADREAMDLVCAPTIERLYERIGICPSCRQDLVHDLDEPFAYCRCGTREWAFNFDRLDNEPLLIQVQVLKYLLDKEKRKRRERRR